MNYETRVGIGFDVHQFCEPKKSENNTQKICGFDVPHTHSLKGHSDADVGIHAIVDAILGAIKENDIGYHFSDKDPAFKDMDSSNFLKFSGELVKKKQGKIINIDVVLICQKPRVGKYRDEMVDSLASILNISSERINVKATTTEGLGYTGRSEGMAAKAVASVLLPAIED